ncbi:MAG TPA: CcmD family protein [Polyangia bacterium]|nr:CcmD family protein [Polyangia bacterium]
MSLLYPPPEQGFQAIQGAPATTQESIPAATLIASAYGFIWLVVLLYLLVIWRRGQSTEREIDELKRKLEAARGGDR